MKDPDAPKVNNPAADGDNSTAVQIVENNTGDGDNAANDKSKDAEGAKDAEEGKFIWHFFYILADITAYNWNLILVGKNLKRVGF